MKKLLWKLVPRKLNLYFLLFRNYAYDLKRYVSYSSIFRIDNQIKFKADLFKRYHSIEKRLAFKHSRVGFAPEKIYNLLQKLEKYCLLYGADEVVDQALNSLLAYHNYNHQNGLNDAELLKKIMVLKSQVPETGKSDDGGFLVKTKAEIQHSVTKDFKSFCESRFSIRDFSPEPIDLKLIREAVKIAQKTPSVCNRQSAKVYAYQSSYKDRILKHQNGNKGFGDQASLVLIITSDLSHFTGIGERNQCWIDGGMFAMSLVYALHSLGLGTCCLNWSMDYQADLNLKKTTGIGGEQSVIMLIAVGHLPDSFKVAWSPRKKIDDIFVINNLDDFSAGAETIDFS